MASLAAFILVLIAFAQQANAEPDNLFQTSYNPQWGGDHLTVNPQGTVVQLKFDNSSGAGFRSKSDFGSGFFHMRMKIPAKKTGGLNTNFYLTSTPSYGDGQHHFEVDFEFIGTNGTLQTNVYDNDAGGREESFVLWFDPSKHFHSYYILWNSRQIVFWVDKIPIRVFKNNEARGIPYPNKPMHIEASLWNAEWAGELDWTQVPFLAYYTDFGLNACSDISTCDSDRYFWNRQHYLELSESKKKQMIEYRSKYMTYDYCSQQSTRKNECSFNV